MSLIRSIFWVALFVASTFSFIVLFEYGPRNFVENSHKEVASLKRIFNLAEDTRKEGVSK